MRQDSVRMMTPHGGIDERALGPSVDHLGQEDRLGCQRRSRSNPSYEDVETLRAEVIEDFWRFVGRERIVVTELPRLTESPAADDYAYQRAFTAAYFREPSEVRRYVTVRLEARGRRVRR